MHPADQADGFPGFDRPTANYFRLPTDWVNITADIDNLAQLKVVEYILRHTWGYQEYGLKKHITIDEFVRGRRRRDGTRMDKGTGLSERAVRYGLAKALAAGMIEEQVDNTDRARIKKYYSLHMRADGAPVDDGVHGLQAEVQTLHPEVQDVPPRGATSAPRTEINTQEKNLEKGYYTPSPLSTSKGLSPSKFERADAEKIVKGTNEDTSPKTFGATSSRGREGFTRIGSMLGRRPLTRESQLAPPPQTLASPVGQPPQPRRLRPAPAPQTEERQVIQTYVEEVAEALQDRAPLSASVTRAMHLYERSGLRVASYIQELQQAKRETQRRGKTMRYFFGVLEDYVGLRDKPEGSTGASATSERQPAAAPAPSVSRRQRKTIGGPLVRVIAQRDEDEAGAMGSP